MNIHREQILDDRAGDFRPKISVAMITYNHETFIADAIESALMQCSQEPFEIIAGDDASTDGTASVIARYQRRFPDRFCVIRAVENRGMFQNFCRTLEHCRGDYVALLEGDDFWISPSKLKRQSEFLDRNPHCPLVFHPARLICEKGTTAPPLFPTVVNPLIELSDLLYKNPIPTCSVMFRRELLPKPPSWLAELVMIDWPIFILLTQHGPAAFDDSILAAYRIHAGGAWTQKTYPARIEAIIRMLRSVGRHLKPRHRTMIRRNIARIYFELATFLENEGELRPALAASWNSVLNHPLGRTYLNSVLRLYGRRYLPNCLAALLQREQIR